MFMSDRTADLPHQILPPISGKVRFCTLIVFGAVMMGAGVLLAPGGIGVRMLIVSGLAILLVAAFHGLRLAYAHHLRRRLDTAITGLIGADATPSLVTDADGMIKAANVTAREQFAGSDAPTLSEVLRSLFANPSAVLYRLQRRARLDGVAQEDVVARGGHMRISARWLDGQRCLWRVERMSDQPQANAEEGDFPFGILTLGRTGTILQMNATARGLLDPRSRRLEDLFAELPLVTGVVNVLHARTGPVEVIVAERDTVARQREILFLPLGPAGAVRQQALFDRLPVALVKIAPGGDILLANREARCLAGERLRPGVPLDSGMQWRGRPVAEWLREALGGRTAQRSEFLRLARSDREVFVQVTLSTITDGGQRCLIGVLNDATELKTLEAQFVQSQKMQAIGQLAGGIAHDFNNLLTAISGHCDLLLLRHDQGDQDYGDLIQISQNANRAAALVSQLLAFSRKQTLRPEPVDLRDTLADLTHLLNRLVGERVSLTLSHEPLLRHIKADKRQLEQVLMNLVVNARDAMPGGGEIRIETAVRRLDAPLQRDRATVAPGEYVVVKVADQGVGIPADQMTKIFEPFFTTKRTGEGTGLGLSTVYGIIKQTGGFIFVDSTEGNGTVFTLYFPAHDSGGEIRGSRGEPAALPAPRHGEGVVLLVEDEAPVRAFAARALRLRGYTVLEAESGEEALRMLDEPELEVDAFVTDVVMPGLDGPSWVRKALVTRPDVRVVFMSGYAEGAFEECGPTLPNSVFLPKPFSLNQLTETVHQQLN